MIKLKSLMSEGFFDNLKKAFKAYPDELRGFAEAVIEQLKTINNLKVIIRDAEQKSSTSVFDGETKISASKYGLFARRTYESGAGNFEFKVGMALKDTTFDKVKPGDSVRVVITIGLDRANFRDNSSMMANTNYTKSFEKEMDIKADEADAKSKIVQAIKSLVGELSKSIEEIANSPKFAKLNPSRHPARVAYKDFKSHLIGLSI